MYIDYIHEQNKNKNKYIDITTGDIAFLVEHPAILNKLTELAEDKTLRSLSRIRTIGAGNGGFTWGSTNEGGTFWSIILDERNPMKFYTLYPESCPDEMIDLFASMYSEGLTEKNRREAIRAEQG